MSRIQSRVQQIVDHLKKHENLVIEPKELLYQTYCLNKQLFDLYQITREESLPIETKVHLLQQFKDPYDNPFITRDMAVTIVHKFSKPVNYLFSELFKLKKQTYEKEQEKLRRQKGSMDQEKKTETSQQESPQEQEQEQPQQEQEQEQEQQQQQGGNNNNRRVPEDKQTISDIPKVLDDVATFIDQLMNDEKDPQFKNKELQPDLRVILNWVFFPCGLWKITRPWVLS